MSDSTEVVKPTPLISEAQRAEIKSFEQALAALTNAGIETTSVTDYGDGFEAGQDKANFVNKKFIILDMSIVPAAKSDFDRDFAVIRIVTEDGGKFILTDGSETSGLCPQVKSMLERGVTGGVMCEKGLIESSYDYVDEKGKKTPAKTYYFAGM